MLALAIDRWKCMPLPARFGSGLGMNEQIMPRSLAISPAAMRKKVKRSADSRASL
ncbi:hypothetical protein D9M70_518000 [compost metagenome]